MFSRTLKKARKSLQSIYAHYRRKKRRLPSHLQEQFETLMQSLHKAIAKKDKENVQSLVLQLQDLSNQHLKKNFFDRLFDIITALIFALAVALVIRQMWFEFYTIPSGSMRPTLKEGDFLVVSKDDFAIDTLWRTSHFYFNDDLVNRGGIIIFSGAGMDIQDVDTMYFYLIPGKKQYIKRLIGKPGDRLYFYGGLIYGVDKEGNDLKDLREKPWFTQIEHIPFIRFDGKVVTPDQSVQGIYSPTVIYQMNEPVAKLALTSYGQLKGDMLQGFKQFKKYADLWGFKNFAMARILTRQQVAAYTTTNPNTLPDASLYLELSHHPDLSHPKLIHDEYNKTRPGLTYSTSLIPLSNKDLRSLMKGMNTARFTVKNGLASRIGSDAEQLKKYKLLPHLDLPNGTYEFQDGIANKITFGNIAIALPQDHPIYSLSPENVQTLFNQGFEFNLLFSPHRKEQTLIPSRYAYFRNGDLYVNGHPLLLKNDPNLKQFIERENQRKSLFYQPFVDSGPPLQADGTLDKAFIDKYGVVIPDNHYLVLGDNHAMSADSRDFGFVPEENLRGGGAFIFWPPGQRWGTLPQKPYPFFVFPRIIVWSSAIIIIILCSVYYYRRKHRPLKF